MEIKQLASYSLLAILYIQCQPHLVHVYSLLTPSSHLSSSPDKATKGLPSEEGEEEGESEGCEDVDVVGVDPTPDLPYDERKVATIMVECSRHVNLVRMPAENSDSLLERVLGETGYHQRTLLSRLIRILEGDHLARLAYADVSEWREHQQTSFCKSA